ncbi:hypothetical protein ACQ7HM_20905 [Williamsia sp. MIQD14]|uniref:hypothetical protein n=1 Tax=Williamsia sp. MIQD14 TaxID=3425703 RepID=UPI003DA01256
MTATEYGIILTAIACVLLLFGIVWRSGPAIMLILPGVVFFAAGVCIQIGEGPNNWGILLVWLAGCGAFVLSRNRYRQIHGGDDRLVKIVDVSKDGDLDIWYIGPYDSTRAGQVAYSLETDARDHDELESRRITVEPQNWRS